jgi:hypothetical protein
VLRLTEAQQQLAKQIRVAFELVGTLVVLSGAARPFSCSRRAFERSSGRAVEHGALLKQADRALLS